MAALAGTADFASLVRTGLGASRLVNGGAPRRCNRIIDAPFISRSHLCATSDPSIHPA
jgi:hypothetical protein